MKAAVSGWGFYLGENVCVLGKTARNYCDTVSSRPQSLARISLLTAVFLKKILSSVQKNF